MSKCPASFRIISIQKISKKTAAISVERYWWLSTETVGTYTQDAAEKHLS